jgi:hypothetical protein
MNEMRDKVLAALRAAVDERQCQWVEVRRDEAAGAVRIQHPGHFLTLLKLEFEFGQEHCRILLYRDGSPAGGRCCISYDDDEAIEQVLCRFRELLPPPRPKGAASGAPALGECLAGRSGPSRRWYIGICTARRLMTNDGAGH